MFTISMIPIEWSVFGFFLNHDTIHDRDRAFMLCLVGGVSEERSHV